MGIATLYRRFPTREALVEATYRSETERLAASSGELLARLAPEAALRAWMDGFVDYMLTKSGMAEALPAILAVTGPGRFLRHLRADRGGTQSR